MSETFSAVRRHLVNGQVRRDAGFSMAALVIFLTAASILLTISVPSYIMQAKREQEKELIFRGEEYTRAIQKYQRTLNLLPTSVDELLSSNGTRFLRKAYADPVSGEPWRVIILNSDGTLTGSNVYQTMGQVPTTTSVRNTAPATPPAGAASPSVGSLGTNNPITSGPGGGLGAGGGGLGGAGGGLGGAGGGGLGAAGGLGGGAPGTTPNRPAGTGTAPVTSPQPQPQQQATPLQGIIGVGSASKGTGVMIYKEQEQYSNWEFIAQLQQRTTPGAGGPGGGGAPGPGGGGAPAPGGGGRTPQPPAGPGR
jgi:type II secretory pathway pseudopilin PulG